MLKIDRILALANRFEKQADDEEPPTIKGTDMVPMPYFRFFQELQDFTQHKANAKDFDYWVKNISNISVGKYTVNQLLMNYSWWMESIDNETFLEAMGASGTKFRLYTSPKYSVNISDSAFIPGFGTIPKLWLYIGTFEEERKPLMNSGKELSHNIFIWEAIIGVFQLRDENKYDLIEVSHFVEKNKEKINSLRKFFSQPPQLLGSGSDGAAFDIGQGLILKIFKDHFSYQAAKDAIERLHSNPDLARTEVMIYDVGVLGTFRNTTLFYYVMEKLTPVSEFNTSQRDSIRKITKKVVQGLLLETDSLTELKKNIKNFDSKTIKEKISEIVDDLLPKIEGSMDVKIINNTLVNSERPLLKPVWLRSFIEEIAMKYLTNRGDLHIGNLGVANYGELRFFDPAFEGYGDIVNVGREIVNPNKK